MSKKTKAEPVDTSMPKTGDPRLKGASIIREEGQQYICSARKECGEMAKDCYHATPHTWHPLKGCGNDTWCPALISLQEKSKGYFDPKQAMAGKPKPICEPIPVP